MDSKPAVLLVAIASILMGIFFIISQGDNKPIERSQAISYVGEFDEYEVSRNYRGIHFKDGSVHEVYPHTEASKILLLINPASIISSRVSFNTISADE